MRKGYTKLLAHADKIAIVISVLLLILLIITVVYSLRSLGGQVNSALDPDGEVGESPQFDLETAQKLDLKGLTPGR